MSGGSLFTDRAVEWVSRLLVVLRIAMLLFIAYALHRRLGLVDWTAAVFAAYLVARAMRPKPVIDSSISDVHVHVTNTIDSRARAHAIERALTQATSRKGD